MAGAFLALGGGETGFLPEKETGGDGSPGQNLQEGRILPVRVMRAAQGGKGPRVSARLSLEEAARAAAAATNGGTAPRLLARGPEAALRLARAHPGATVETDGPDLAMRLRAALGPDRVSLRAARRPSTTRWKRSGKPSPARARRCRAAGACWCSRRRR